VFFGTARQKHSTKESAMIKFMLMLLVLSTCHAMAGHWRPSEELLAAIRFVESSNGQFVYGDRGRSLGDFQMSEAAWMDVTAWRKARKKPTYDYRRHVLNPTINRAYAADYVTILHGELRRVLKRAPCVGEIYAAYNMGLGTFAQCNYQLALVNRVTAQKCREIKAMVDRSQE
jgi:hypothetical protein